MTTPRFTIRPLVWLLHLALPVLGLWLLAARPDLDAVWENHAAHFWLVLATAGLSAALAAAINAEAGRRRDARLFLVSLAFVVSAGFLGLHALATPGLLLGTANTGFVIASPVGLAVAAVWCVVSAVEFGPAAAARVIAARRALRAAVAALLLSWLAVSFARMPLLDRPLPPAEAAGPLAGLTVVGVILYAVAAVRYWLLYRRRPAVVLISVITAFVLLAEALLATALSRSWHTSWWEWHLLMTVGFAYIGYSALVQWSREGSRVGLFGGIALAQTVRLLRAEYRDALEALVAAMERGGPVEPVADGLADRFELTERQRDVLVEAADALANEREQIRRHAAIVAVGREASVIRAEDDLLARVRGIVGAAFGRDELRVRRLRDGRLEPGSAPPGLTGPVLTHLRPVESPHGAGAILVLPLSVKGKPAGVLEVRRAGPFAERDRALLASFASQLSIAVENARLYQQLDALFRSYISPDVATSLLADPDQAALGGAVAEVTVLMGDLSGFTPFAERTPPAEVVGMLNTYYGIVVPIVLAEGGTVVQFVGDAIMVIFNAPVRQPDHAVRAVRAGLAAQAATGNVASRQPGWPRFRVGINTGPALVGNIGAAQIRNFTAIGDTTNLAARLEAAAGVGEVVVSGSTLALLGEAAVAQSLGPLQIKGKADPVAAYRLLRLADAPDGDRTATASP